MFEQTGVDGIMIGRGAFGNPWIFRKIIHYLETGEKNENPSSTEMLEVIIKHLDLEIEEKGIHVGIKEFRKHLAAYSKCLPKSSEFRVKVNKIENIQELKDEITNYFKNI